jgi:PAS domain S-box-containing protein
VLRARDQGGTVEMSESQEAVAHCRRLEERLRVLSDATRAFAEATTDSQRLLDLVARRVAEVVKDYCVVLLLSDDGTILIPASMFDPDPEALRRMRDVLTEPILLEKHPLARRVIESGTPFLAARLVREDFRPPRTTPRYFEFIETEGIHSLLMVAMRAHDRSIGQLVLARFRPGSPPFDEHDLALAQSLADHAALAVSNARLLTAERTARDAAEKAIHALRQAKAHIARLLEAGIIGIVVAGLDGRVVEVNDALLHLLGYSRDEILSGRVDWKSLTPPAGWEADARAVEQLKIAGVGEVREKEYIRKDGARVPVLVGSALLEGETDQCIAFVLDLTERRAAQAAVDQLREERAADVKIRDLAAIVDSSDDAILGMTLDGAITSWNQGAVRLFGYSANEIVGKRISLLFPPEREGEEPSIFETVARGEVKRADTVRRRKDGLDIDVSITCSPVRDASGRVVGVSKVARDITERRRTEADLARAMDAAEAANRELEAFSYSVAHDLRAPLRGMNGFAQLLIDTYRDKLDGEGQDFLREILENAGKMGDLIDGLLSLARVTRSGLRLERADLSQLVRETAARLRASEPHRAVHLTVQDHLLADVDPRLARALFENLLGNAWKFTSKVASPRVEFGTTETDGVHAFFVRDNGAGFDMAFAGKLFAPFQRFHTVDEFAGTGIGLATVQRIVHRHGGRIWAKGMVGGGATFYFTFAARMAGAMS